MSGPSALPSAVWLLELGTLYQDPVSVYTAGPLLLWIPVGHSSRCGTEGHPRAGELTQQRSWEGCGSEPIPREIQGTWFCHFRNPFPSKGEVFVTLATREVTSSHLICFLLEEDQCPFWRLPQQGTFYRTGVEGFLRENPNLDKKEDSHLGGMVLLCCLSRSSRPS